jgi:hypothetical protein
MKWSNTITFVDPRTSEAAKEHAQQMLGEAEQT